MRNNNGNEDALLVSFPSSKHFPVKTELPMDDPLNDLLNEFADVEDTFAADADDSEELLIELSSRPSRQVLDQLKSDMRDMYDTSLRLNYYLGEIEARIENL